ncbi:MAG: hypothetical protein IT159_00095 [Bryobacterales bacterium]|nr:hypothetical protein [Bryobacterales bacterium]
MKPLLLLALLAAAACHADSGAGDARAIVLRSAERDQADLDVRRDYTFLTRTEQRTLDESGGVKEARSRTHEVLVLYGRPYERLIAEDDRPLPPREEGREQQKMDREIARRRNETAKQKEKRELEAGRDLQRQREILREVADAFDFHLLGEEEMEGHSAWVIQADPRPDFKPRSRQARILRSFRGRVWVTKDEYRWVKLEAEAVRGISFGLVLARLNSGATVRFEQTRVHGEVWMPSRIEVRARGRLAMLKSFRAETIVTYSDYRKFQSDSRITDAVEVPSGPPR